MDFVCDQHPLVCVSGVFPLIPAYYLSSSQRNGVLTDDIISMQGWLTVVHIVSMQEWLTVVHIVSMQEWLIVMHTVSMQEWLIVVHTLHEHANYMYHSCML